MKDFNKSLGNVYLSDPRFRISYLVPHPDQDLSEASLFTGATAGLIDTAYLIETIMDFPADVREICSEWRHIAIFRCNGLIAHRILPIEYSAFAEIVNYESSLPFRCVLSNEDTVEYVDRQIAKTRDIWLHLSTVSGRGRIDIKSVTRKDFLDYVQARLGQMLAPQEKYIVQMCTPLLNEKEPGHKKTNLPKTGHNLTRFNERALQAFGAVLPIGPHSPGTEKNAVRWITKSYDFVNRRRGELLPTESKSFLPLNAMMLTFPATFREASNRKYIGQFARITSSTKLMRKALTALIKPKSYLWHIDSEVLNSLQSNPAIVAFIHIRQRELALYTSLLVRLSAEALVPTLRLNPAIGSVRGLLKHLGECSRLPGPRKHEKRLSLYTKIQNHFQNELHLDFQSRIEALGAYATGIKLVSDMPLEWLPVKGLPLMLRYECSRVPLTPTRLAYMVATNLDPVILTPSQLHDVLVIRSFTPVDKIRFVLEEGIQAGYKSFGGSKIQVTFKDVTTEEEFVDAINEHEGAIVIFDCHGYFDSDDYIASLMIGETPIKLWELRKRIKRMPPIVLLSACDTEPLDSAHTSVGAGMLLLGAKTVLATFLPIDAFRAAMFLGRFIYRLDAFVPAALQHQTRVTWREVVSGMIKMSHLTEVLFSLFAKGYLDSYAYHALHFNGNQDINFKRADWFERLIDGLAVQLNCSKERTKNIVGKCSGLTDALLYTQLGNPELIFINKNEWDDFLPTATM